MTKRELIDRIISENRTADPSFLAQFSDEQLREYLAHLKWIHQPRMSGDAARFDKYFPDAVPPPARQVSGKWRAEEDRQPPRTDQADSPAQDSLPPDEPTPQQLSFQTPAESAFDEFVLPPTEQLHDLDDTSSQEESLEDMQVTPKEREHLRQGPEDSPQPPGGAETENQPPFADTDTNAQAWLF